MSKNTCGAVIAVALLALMFSAVPLCTDTSSADDRVIVTSPDEPEKGISLQASSSKSIYVHFANTKPYLEHDFTDEILVKVDAEILTVSGDAYGYMKAYARSSDGHDWTRIDGRASQDFIVTIESSKFAQTADYILSLTYTVSDYDGSNVQDSTKEYSVHVKSELSTDVTYNKLLGYFDNPLPSPLNEVWATAVITVILWLLIGIAISAFAVPFITLLASDRNDPERPKFKRMLTKWCIVITLVYAQVNTLCVIGVDEVTVSAVKSYAHLVYLVIGALLLWRIYVTFLNRISEEIRRRDPGGENRFDAFKPLFVYIGEIILAIATVFLAMGMLGFDLTAAITSAGIVSLGITFGAQQVLAQFFAGLVILATRPFKKGDLLQLGSNTSITYRVRKVTVMFTELENWDNSDITIVPNNSLTNSNVKNITRDTLRTKVHLFMEVSYDSDLAFVRSTMLEVANSNPRIIKDGSVSRPSTRVTSFNSSNIEIRLTVWVDDYNDSFAIAGELRAALFKKFNEVGIVISYDQVVVNYADGADEKNRTGKDRAEAGGRGPEGPTA